MGGLAFFGVTWDFWMPDFSKMEQNQKNPYDHFLVTYWYAKLTKYQRKRSTMKGRRRLATFVTPKFSKNPQRPGGWLIYTGILCKSAGHRDVGDFFRKFGVTKVASRLHPFIVDRFR